MRSALIACLKSSRFFGKSAMLRCVRKGIFPGWIAPRIQQCTSFQLVKPEIEIFQAGRTYLKSNGWAEGGLLLRLTVMAEGSQ